MGGGNFVVPAQTVKDFMDNTFSGKLFILNLVVFLGMTQKKETLRLMVIPFIMAMRLLRGGKKNGTSNLSMTHRPFM